MMISCTSNEYTDGCVEYNEWIHQDKPVHSAYFMQEAYICKYTFRIMGNVMRFYGEYLFIRREYTPKLRIPEYYILRRHIVLE